MAREVSRDRGLVVGVPPPEFRFEHDLDNVRGAAGEGTLSEPHMYQLVRQ